MLVADLDRRRAALSPREAEVAVLVAAGLDRAAGVALPEVGATSPSFATLQSRMTRSCPRPATTFAKLARGAENPLVRPDVEAATERQATYAHDACGVQD